jgi:hypothetical protein
MAGVMMTSTSSAQDVPPCSCDAVPIQIVGEAGSGPVTKLSAIKYFANEIGGDDPHFGAFVTTVMEHVATRLAEEKLCICSERALFQFMHWYLSPSNPDKLPTPVTSLDIQPSGSCRISSPWIDLAFERKPVPWIRAIVRWNERQLLADQAVLAGAKNVPLGVAKPLTSRELYSFKDEHDKTTKLEDLLEIRRLLHKLQPERQYLVEDITELEHQLAAMSPIKERIPPDLLWLFQRSPSTDLLNVPLKHSMGRAMAKGAESYTELVNVLIDYCFVATEGTSLRYNNILDATYLIPLEQYKIETQIAY